MLNASTSRTSGLLTASSSRASLNSTGNNSLCASGSNIVPARLAGVTRCKFWFADGNFVLVARGVAFKVHRGQLERHSDFFRDLFYLPLPPDGDMIFGCPYVEMHDAPEDVLRLLKALYDGLYFPQHHADDFENVASVIRMSQKYFLRTLQERGLGRLLHDWPVCLSGWETRERKAHATGGYTPRTCFAHPIHVINAGRELRVLEPLLPCAFYDLCRYGPSKIVTGVAAVIRLAHLHEDELADEQRARQAGMVHLSQEDLAVVLRGREAAQRYIATFIEEELVSRRIAAGCENREDDAGRVCRESFYFIMLNVMRSVGGIACGRDADPLFTLQQAAEMLERTDFSDGVRTCGLKLCTACKKDFAKSTEYARKRVWSMIPGWFGLGADKMVVDLTR